MTKVQTEINRTQEQANFIKTRRMCEELGGDSLFCLTAFNLNRLVDFKESVKNVKTWKDTAFAFNCYRKENTSSDSTSFSYNETCVFVKNLYKKHGDNIYDKRFAGFYFYTKRRLKKRYNERFEVHIKENASLSSSTINQAILKSLKQLKKESWAFEMGNNGEKSALEYELRFKKTINKVKSRRD